MSKRSWIKIIPYGLLALFTVLVVYDPTLDASQLENTPVTQIADISTLTPVHVGTLVNRDFLQHLL